MPWLETNRELERIKFIAALQESGESFSAICQRFGISRQTGYAWRARFEAGGAEALSDRPPVAHTHGNATDSSIEGRLVEVRKAHPTWGPKKVRAWLMEREAEVVWPAASTVGDIFSRRGLTGTRRKRVRVPPSPSILTAATCPNALWTADHKGDFPLISGRSYPLTVMDLHSRFLLKCESLPSTSVADARPHFERAFREFGLPERIRTDNGGPFARPNTPAGLSRLSVWWVRLGIGLERIERGHPEQNGAHERMHRTLKAEAIEPGRDDHDGQQRRFDLFRRIYNHERPHESLDMRAPASVYETSWRVMPAEVPPMEYNSDHAVRRVGTNGVLCWKGHHLNLGTVLGGERVGLKEVDESCWSLSFGTVHLALFDGRKANPKLDFISPAPSQTSNEPV